MDPVTEIEMLLRTPNYLFGRADCRVGKMITPTLIKYLEEEADTPELGLTSFLRVISVPRGRVAAALYSS